MNERHMRAHIIGELRAKWFEFNVCLLRSSIFPDYFSVSSQ